MGAVVVAGVVTVLTLAACGLSQEQSPVSPIGQAEDAEQVEVRFVADGDTVQLSDGRWVRLVQIDAPEDSEDRAECYGSEARDALEARFVDGIEVEIIADPALDGEDRFERLLRYLIIDGVNVNRELVGDGFATVWFFMGSEGRFAEDLLAAGQTAQAEGRGLWGACPGTPFEVERGADTGPVR